MSHLGSSVEQKCQVMKQSWCREEGADYTPTTHFSLKLVSRETWQYIARKVGESQNFYFDCQVGTL